MVARYNRWSFVFGVPGLLLQFVGFAYAERPQPRPAVSVLAQLAGGVLLIIGLGFYAKAKGRTGTWGLLGLFSFFGMILLALLPDLASTGVALPARGWAVASARKIGAAGVPPSAMMRLAAPITIAVDKDAAVQRDGRSVAVFQKHAAGFLGKLATSERFTIADAAAWEPGYAPEDVAAILATLAHLDVIAIEQGAA